MSNKLEPNFNWAPYEEDIISFYVTQNHTRQETVAYLQRKYSLHVTEKQFKTKFGGYKNISFEEWKEIIPRVQKRALEGKESEVFLCGTPLGPKRLKLGINRYSSKIQAGNSSNVVEQSFLDRINIATPPSAPLSPPPISLEPTIDQEIEEILRSEMPVPIGRSPCPIPSPYPSQNGMGLIFQHDTLDAIEDFPVNFDEVLDIQLDMPEVHWYPPDAEALWNPDEDIMTQAPELLFINTVVWPMHTPSDRSPFGNFRSNLLNTLPWFQLKDLLSRSNIEVISPRISNVHGSMSWIGAPTTFGSSRESKTLDVSSTECQIVLTNLLKSGSGNQVGELVPTFTVELQKFLPERHMGELSTQVKKLFDPSHKQPIQQLFEIVAYFSSNNMLSSSQTETFVRWVVDQKYVDPLKLFLQIDMPTVHAFRSRLLEAGIRAQQPLSFLKQMHAAGAKFDECAQQVMEINDCEFLLFVLTQLDPELLKGESGGQLLHKHVSRTPYISVVQKLVQAGAEVNIRLSNDFKTTPLWEAIKKKSLDIVKCLVDGGADVNKLSFIKPTSSLGHALYQNHQPIVEYLLDKEADTEVDVFSVPILEYAASHTPELYSILLKRLPDVPGIASAQIVSSANSDPKVWSKFLSQHPELSEQRLEEALVESLKLGKTKAVVNLLQHGVDPNGPHLGKASKRPLEVAITDPETCLVTQQYMDLLIHAKADVNIDGLIFTLLETWTFDERVFDKLIEAGFDLDRYGAEVLESAVLDHNEVIPYLLDKGVSIDSYGTRFTVLQAAAKDGGDVQLLRLLIDRGADINAPPFAVKGRTALQAAALSGNMEMLRLLYDHGADINGPIALTDGITALEATSRPWESEYDDDWCEYDDVPTEAFLFLLDHGASVNRPDGSPSPLLHDLIELKGTDLLRRALEAKANANHYWRTVSSSWFDRTPLQLAAEKGQLESIRLLLDSGASPNESPAHKHGRTALQAAASCETPSMELIQLLLSHGAVINAPPAASGGITALQGAAIRGHINIAQMLIENGAEVNALPALKDGCTAIEGAAEHGRLDMAKMLINAGATGDVVGKTRFTKAISLAKKNRHFQVAKLLEAQ